MKQTILIFFCCIALSISASTKKKIVEEVETTESPPPGSALLAIEIVDGNDTSTGVRNATKRTIESALGYGFQGNYFPTSQAKKYMVYPYSQQDIPSTDASKILSSQILNIQKSVSYNLGTKIEPTAATKESYTSGAISAPVYTMQPVAAFYPSTLYSTVGQSGLIGGLSTHIPSQQQTSASTVPVIILRVYTNQLMDSAIYPNLPQTHPYANNLNSVNLQSILSNYLQQQLYQQQQYKPVYQQNVAYPDQGQTYQDQNLFYPSQQGGYQLYQTQGAYQQEQPQIDLKALEESAANLPTHENYPSDSHTRVIYHGPRGHINNYAGSTYESPAKTQIQSYSTNTHPIYTDSKGQSYIYVNPNQIQSQEYYQPSYQPQDYSQQGSSQQDYTHQEYQQQSNVQQGHAQQEQLQQDYSQQTYAQPEYTPQSYVQQDYTQSLPQQDYTQSLPQQNYQPQSFKQQEDRRYLPVNQQQSTADKVFNYHVQNLKDRSKKSSGSPVTFDIKVKEKTSAKKV